MSDPDPTDSDVDTSPRYDDWPVAEPERDYELVGATTGGVLLYSPSDETLVDAMPDHSEGKLVPDLDTERPLGEDGLGGAIEEFADEHDLDALSEFAREHLERTENEKES